jgi:prepilin-type processing-associated H-X9-DG protein
VELLIAIGVVALMLSILVPALSQAREEGRGGHCAAELHNAGVAVTVYLADNDETFWPYYLDVTKPVPGRRWWFGFEPDGPPSNPWVGHRRLDKTGGFLSRYLARSPEDFLCPAFPYQDAKYFPKFDPPAGGYGYNTAALAGYGTLAPPGYRLRRAQEFDGQTADVFVLADGVHFDRLDYSSHPPLDQQFNEPAYIQWQDPAFYGSNLGVQGGFGHFRHNGRAMVLYLDSHVGAQPVRRPLHPYTRKHYGRVANLSDDALRVRQIKKGNRVMSVDYIYGLK